MAVSRWDSISATMTWDVGPLLSLRTRPCWSRLESAISKGAARSVDWIHLPVPKSRVDAACFAPLKQLRLADTELHLGLLHSDGELGTRESDVWACD